MLNEQMKKDNNKLADADNSNPNKQKIMFGIFCVVVILMFIVLYSLLMPKQEVEEKKQETTTFKAKDKSFELETRVIEPVKEYIQELPNKVIEKAPQPEKKAEVVKIPKIIKSAAVVGTAANIENDALSLMGQLKSDEQQRQKEARLKNLENMGEVYSPSAAYFSNFDQNLLLAKGTYISCSLKTKLVSDLGGGIACIISNDVYSNNGKTLLIEKGSLVTGSYKGASIEEGQERIYVIWQEIRTPNNIIIPVYSGASDELGAAGASGEVDSHFLRRFGLAILVSLINDGTKAATQNLNRTNNKDGNNNVNISTADKASDVATKVLDKMKDIKPTLYKNQGDIIGIYVNRDIDFSNVYELKKKR